MHTTPERLSALQQLVGGLPREWDEYLRANARGPNKHGHHDTRLKGNLGRLFVTGNHRFNCNNWIAGSPKADEFARLPVQNGENDLYYIGSFAGSRKLFFAGKENKAAEFPERFEAGRDDARDDSEYLLLNALGFALKKFEVSHGVAYLLTERVPCDSCTHVINQFLGEYPEFRIEIFYLFDSPKRSHRQFLQECAVADRVSLFFCQLTSEAIQFVEVDAQTPITVFPGSLGATAGPADALHVLSRIKPSKA